MHIKSQTRELTKKNNKSLIENYKSIGFVIHVIQKRFSITLSYENYTKE